MATSAGVQRVLSKLQISINAGNYYEAHQMYRTLYFRYLALKKYSDLLTLLFDGSHLLLSHTQQASGADLAVLLVEVLAQSHTKPDSEWFNKLSRLITLISPDIPDREKLIVNALQWSKTGTENKTGHPQLHQLLAQIFWREKNYPAARHHFLHSADGIGCARMLVELHKERGFTTEVDLFIAQAVLQYLCLQDKSTANAVFHNYTLQHPDIKTGPPYILPLLNFIWLLLKLIESGKLAAFTVLCEQYQPCLRRDPSYSDYLTKIGQLFFGLAPPRPRAPGLFGNLLQSFLSGLDDSDEEEETSSARASVSGPARDSNSRQRNQIPTNIQTTPSMDTEELD